MSTYPATADLPQNGSIVSRWLLDEASGNRSDSVGSNTLTDNNTVAASSGLVKTGANFDNAADFTAANSEYLSKTDVASLDLTGAFTIAFWYNPDLFTGGDLLGKWGGTTADQQYLWRIESATRHRLIVQSSDANTQVDETGASFSAGTWYHMVGVYVPSTRLTLYLDGVKTEENTTSIPASIDGGAADFTLGGGSGGSQFTDQQMQDCIIWSGAGLTDTEVSDFYRLYQSAAQGQSFFM